MQLGDLLDHEPGFPAGRIEISGITADSREVKPGYLFAALAGVRADGSSFIADAVNRGAAAILTGEDAAAHPAVLYIRDANPRRRLALMAAKFYGSQPRVIAAVTGTNGKTSVVAFVRQIWEKMGFSAASLGTVGLVSPSGQMPVGHTTPDPVTLHRQLAGLAETGVDHLALEASSHGLAQYRLDGLAFTAAAFTNLTRDHLDYHHDFESYFEAKLRLFTELLPTGAGAVINADQPEADRVIAACMARGHRIITVGQNGKTLRLAGAERQGLSQRLELELEGRRQVVLLPLAGDFQASNALVAAGLALAAGGDPAQVFTTLQTIEGAKGRLELAGRTPAGAPVFVDYAHTPDALQKALETLRPYATGKLAVVFGCGGDRDRGKRPQMGAIAVRLGDRVYVTDDNPRGEVPATIRAEILEAAPGAVEIGERAQAIAIAVAELAAGDVLLIAGKGHETGQSIGGVTVPFSDHETAAAALAALQAKKDRS